MKENITPGFPHLSSALDRRKREVFNRPLPKQVIHNRKVYRQNSTLGPYHTEDGSVLPYIAAAAIVATDTDASQPAPPAFEPGGGTSGGVGVTGKF